MARVSKTILIIVSGTVQITQARGIRLAYPVGREFIGLQLGYFPMYICMFAFGILAQQSSWLDQLERRQVNLWFGMAVTAILLLPGIVLLGGAFSGNADKFPGGLS